MGNTELSLKEIRKQIVEHNGTDVLIGGRQVGKTETLITVAISKSLNHQSVGVIAPAQRQVSTIKDRIEETATDAVMGNIYFDTAYNIEREGFTSVYDVVLVDEAAFMSNDVLLEIDKSTTPKKVYSTTPTGHESLVEFWAEYSPEHRTWHIPSTTSELIDVNDLQVWAESMSDDSIETEVFGKYWDGDSPTLDPYFVKGANKTSEREIEKMKTGCSCLPNKPEACDSCGGK